MSQHLVKRSHYLSLQDIAKLQRLAEKFAGGNATNILRQLIRQADESKFRPDYAMQKPHPDTIQRVGKT